MGEKQVDERLDLTIHCMHQGRAGFAESRDLSADGGKVPGQERETVIDDLEAIIDSVETIVDAAFQPGDGEKDRVGRGGVVHIV